MEKLDKVLQETNPDKVLFHLEYMEIMMEMFEKRNKKHNLEEEYQKLLKHYKQITKNNWKSHPFQMDDFFLTYNFKCISFNNQER